MFKNIIAFLVLALNLNYCFADNNLNLIKVYVTDVQDGDTITFIKSINDSKRIAVKGRLYGIDAPELQQEFGTESKNELRKLILNKEVYMNESSIDMYGRSIVKIFLNEVYINEKLVKDGFAWSYKEYNDNNTLLNTAEIEARSKRLGLWNTQSPIYPSHWRKLRKLGNSVVINDKCDYTISCSKIKTCQEAMYLLNECNFYFLDKNNDGIPCETLCKTN
jgi:endonuclease YncB( thermonuclease family)